MIVLCQDGKQFVPVHSRDGDHLKSKGFGEPVDGRQVISFYETVFLVERGKAEVRDRKHQHIPLERLVSKRDFDRQLYTVFADLRAKGHVVRSGLKYGFAFRVYEKGVKPGEDHALWLVEPLSEHQRMRVRDISGKNRVAHSTRKRMLFAIVDDEGSVTYIENIWKRL